MKPITRRSVMAGSAAVVAAVPAMRIAAEVKEHPEEDPLLDGIRLHRKMIEAINALPDDVDGDVTEADAILEEALTHPVISWAGAFAVIDLALDEVCLFANSGLSNAFQTRAKEARDFIALIA